MSSQRACKPPAVMVAVLVLSLCASAVPDASASSVAPMSLTKMSQHTAQAFVGEVTTTTSRWAENPKRIVTDVTFVNVRYLKGGPAATNATSRTLTVPGGEVEGVQARICCAPRFEVGQRWVLLVLPEYRVYPVVGLHQGAIRVQKDESGIERVYHASARPITGIDAEGFVLIENARFDLETQQRLHAAHVNSRNLRINTEPAAEKTSSEAMPLTDFLAALQPKLDASKSYSNAEQAGRRVPGVMKAVPLRKAAPHADQEEVENPKSKSAVKLRGAETTQRSDSHRQSEPQAEQQEVTR